MNAVPPLNKGMRINLITIARGSAALGATKKNDSVRLFLKKSDESAEVKELSWEEAEVVCRNESYKVFAAYVVSGMRKGLADAKGDGKVFGLSDFQRWGRKGGKSHKGRFLSSEEARRLAKLSAEARRRKVNGGLP